MDRKWSSDSAHGPAVEPVSPSGDALTQAAADPRQPSAAGYEEGSSAAGELSTRGNLARASVGLGLTQR